MVDPPGARVVLGSVRGGMVMTTIYVETAKAYLYDSTQLNTTHTRS
jgi:hypothetical protein